MSDDPKRRLAGDIERISRTMPGAASTFAQLRGQIGLLRPPLAPHYPGAAPTGDGDPLAGAAGNYGYDPYNQPGSPYAGALGSMGGSIFSAGGAGSPSPAPAPTPAPAPSPAPVPTPTPTPPPFDWSSVLAGPAGFLDGLFGSIPGSALVPGSIGFDQLDTLPNRVGMTNLLLDPTFESVPVVNANLGTVKQTYGRWAGHYVLNSGAVAPSVISVSSSPRGDPNNNPFDSALIAITMPRDQVYDVDVYWYPDTDLLPSGIPTYSFVVASGRIAAPFGVATSSAFTTLTAQMELYDATGATALAQGDVFSIPLNAINTNQELFASTPELGVANVLAGQWRWRMHFHVVCNGANTAGQNLPPFGEPMLHFSTRRRPHQFSPQLGGWKPAITTLGPTYLGADVTITNANQFYDGPTLALTQGTWLLIGAVKVNDNANVGAPTMTAKLWDGTTVLASADTASDTAGDDGDTLPLMGLLIVGSAGATAKISVASGTATNGRIKAAAGANSPGNYASYLFAIQVGV